MSYSNLYLKIIKNRKIFESKGLYLSCRVEHVHQTQRLRLESAQAPRQHKAGQLSVRRGFVAQRQLGPAVADRSDPVGAGDRRGAILVGLRTVRGAVSRRRATHPRADRHRAPADIALPQARAASDDERRAGKRAPGRGDRQPGRDRGWPQHRHLHGGTEELPSIGRALHDPDPQVQHSMVGSNDRRGRLTSLRSRDAHVSVAR